MARVMKSLYGTRDAANNWQNEVAKVMREWGFQRGMYNPCLYWNQKLGVQTLVHGDDFVSVGPRVGVKELERRLEERFEIKTKIVGRGLGESIEPILEACARDMHSSHACALHCSQ